MNERSLFAVLMGLVLVPHLAHARCSGGEAAESNGCRYISSITERVRCGDGYRDGEPDRLDVLKDQQCKTQNADGSPTTTVGYGGPDGVCMGYVKCDGKDPEYAVCPGQGAGCPAADRCLSLQKGTALKQTRAKAGKGSASGYSLEAGTDVVTVRKPDNAQDGICVVRLKEDGKFVSGTGTAVLRNGDSCSSGDATVSRVVADSCGAPKEARIVADTGSSAAPSAGSATSAKGGTK